MDVDAHVECFLSALGEAERHTQAELVGHLDPLVLVAGEPSVGSRQCLLLGIGHIADFIYRLVEVGEHSLVDRCLAVIVEVALAALEH